MRCRHCKQLLSDSQGKMEQRDMFVTELGISEAKRNVKANEMGPPPSTAFGKGPAALRGVRVPS